MCVCVSVCVCVCAHTRVCVCVCVELTAATHEMQSFSKELRTLVRQNVNKKLVENTL